MSLNEQQLAKLNKVQLDESWKYGLSEFLLSPKMDELKAFLVEEKKADKIIYPPNHLIFNALNTTPLDRVKVVILGQDPYHGPNTRKVIKYAEINLLYPLKFAYFQISAIFRNNNEQHSSKKRISGSA